jgi:hypothetical protein
VEADQPLISQLHPHQELLSHEGFSYTKISEGFIPKKKGIIKVCCAETIFNKNNLNRPFLAFYNNFNNQNEPIVSFI